MESTSLKGNDPEKWSKLLGYLDDRLQLGLLDRLSRISAYHVEADTLHLILPSAADVDYLQKPAVLQQLQVLCGDAIGVVRVEVKRPDDGDSV